MNATTDKLVTIYVDGSAYKVKSGGHLLEACLGLRKSKVLLNHFNTIEQPGT